MVKPESSVVLYLDGYTAPEIYRGEKYSGEKVDIFAAGVILFIMTVGHPPFSNANELDLYY